MTLLQLIGLLLLSASPLGEHKIALPLAVGEYEIDPFIAWVICITANMISPPLIWWFLQQYMSTTRKQERSTANQFTTANKTVTGPSP